MRSAWVFLVAGCGFQSQPAELDGVPGVVDASPGTGPADGPDADATPGPFDYARCPASYTNDDLPGPSRYRLIPDGHRAWEQSDACNGDLSGATHLVILETAAEVSRVAALVDQPRMGIAHSAVWVGGVQRATATQPGAAWLGFDGAPLIDLWDDGEPNDDGHSGEADHREQFAMIEHHNTALEDTDGRIAAGALCECDGHPPPAEVLATIDANRLPE